METTLLTTKEAADLLRVSPRTVQNWINNKSIPYVELPPGASGRSDRRIPMRALLNSLSGNYDLMAEVREQSGATNKIGSALLK